MKLVISLLFSLTIISVIVSASVIPDKYTEQKCGNGIREGYELCEPGTAYDICPAIGKLLKIAVVCNEQTCACLPGRTAKDCGNQIREGIEMCDPGTKEPVVDFCPNISAAIGLPLVCDTEICDCVPSGIPVVLSTCGDSKVEGNEDCESDDDCPKGRVCQNCTCIRVEQDLNLTPVQHNVTLDDIPVPTIEDITRKAGKTEIAGFIIEDYVGEIIPEDLDYFDDEKINFYIRMKDGNEYVASAVTTKNVVQEVHPYALNDTSMSIWIDEDTLSAIKASDQRTPLIVSMLSDGRIEYKPAGFFRRIWFWLFRPY